MSRPPTLKDLSTKLGLSVATVSLALRGKGNLSEKTRRRVRMAARQIGYRPNTYAAALSSRVHPNRHHDVPLAIIRRRPNPAAEWYPVQLFVDGIRERASELGYRVEVFPDACSRPVAELLRVLFHRGFKGIFLAPLGDFAQPLPEWSNFSVICCGRFDKTSPFHTVRHDIFESTLDVLNRLIERGCKRIGLALFDHDPPIVDDKQRIAAALVAQADTGRKVVPFFSRGSEKILSMIRKERFDGLVSFSIAAYFDLVAAGISVPGDIEFATLHLYDEEWNKNLSGLLPCEHACGIAAANRMDSMVRHHETGFPDQPEQIVVRPLWRDAPIEKGR